MTESSYYWDGLVTGDATLAPYTHSAFAGNWKKLFTREGNQGVLKAYLNELLVTGIGGGISIASGFAVVNGWVYENTANVTKIISTPVSNPRIDTVVIRMIFEYQTARIFVIKGTETGSPTAPSLIQNNGVVWDMPIAEVLVTTAGVISVTDTREFASTPLSERPVMTLIEEIEILSLGIPVDVSFDNIPQTYRDLIIIGQWRGTDVGVGGRLYYNDDEVYTNYYRQVLNSIGASVIAVGIVGSATVGTDDVGWYDDEGIPFRFTIPNYTGPFYKTCVQDEISTTTLASEGSVWLNVSPITKISLVNLTGTFLTGSKVSLYGL